MSRPLKEYVGLRMMFKGTIVTFGTHKRTDQQTVLIIDVEDITFFDVKFSHIWCISNKNFNSSNLKKGQIIEFEATVRPYRKGPKIDYGLSQPKRLRYLGRSKKFDPIKKLPPSKRIRVTSIMGNKSNIPKK